MARTKSDPTYKKTHRGHNEGSIFQKSNGRWVAQVQVGLHPDGRRKFVNFYGKTRTEVADKLANCRSDISRNLFVEPSKITFEEWLWNWMKNFKKPNVRATTYARYLSLVNLYIIPEVR